MLLRLFLSFTSLIQRLDIIGWKADNVSSAQHDHQCTTRRKAYSGAAPAISGRYNGTPQRLSSATASHLTKVTSRHAPMPPRVSTPSQPPEANHHKQQPSARRPRFQRPKTVRASSSHPADHAAVDDIERAPRTSRRVWTSRYLSEHALDAHTSLPTLHHRHLHQRGSPIPRQSQPCCPPPSGCSSRPPCQP